MNNDEKLKQNVITHKSSTISKKKKKSSKRLTQADIKKYSNGQIDHVILKIKAKERQYTIISVIAVLLITSFILLLSFSSVQKEEGRMVFEVENLEIQYQSHGQELSNIVSLVNLHPLSDKDGLKTEKYSFSVTNTGKKKSSYQVCIIDDIEMIELDECFQNLVDRKFVKYSVDGKNIFRLTENEEDCIIADDLDPNKTKKYQLNFFISEEFTKIKNSHFHAKIVVKKINKVAQ